MGNGTTCSELAGLITYDAYTRVVSPRPFHYLIMDSVTGNEKRMTRVRTCPVKYMVLYMNKKHKCYFRMHRVAHIGLGCVLLCLMK